MELGTLERHIHIDASPEVVYEVVSRPEHIREWWSDEASLDPTPGAVGEISWHDGPTETLTVVDADPPRRFSFRWVAPEGAAATDTNSLLVTFELTASNGGTQLHLVETGFREKGWETAVLEEQYHDHETGWDHFLPRLRDRAIAVGADR
ncbi:SRPBCC domain-containing protein [Luteipulveratus halotolerans]|uniref:Polyketide cyclase n=1 Tax=Luteipulveratus halotolerans TaxID=1631356 RepID=A0A0L6CLK2_9MICO|nr:SRPBCC domain-containing protein [Luteipulveratus halotolerans]KNX38604.1 polyketide cyclase [Luteipulveratus halotolerans]